MKDFFIVAGVLAVLALAYFGKRSQKAKATRSYSNTATSSFSLTAVILAKEFGETIESEIAELVAAGNSREDIAQLATENAAKKIMVKHGIGQDTMVQVMEEYARELRFKD